MAFVLQAIVFFIYTPGAFDPAYAVAVGGGVIVTLIVGEVLVRSALARRSRPDA